MYYAKQEMYITNEQYNYVIDGVETGTPVANGVVVIYKPSETKNTIWGNIKQLLVENLELNDNILLDIVLCYTILWLIMWILWHVFYGFFELIWHLIPRKE